MYRFNNAILSLTTLVIIGFCVVALMYQLEPCIKALQSHNQQQQQTLELAGVSQ